MVVGRLAPSPTGAQHLGNARTFLVAWLSIRAQQGHLLLRIEDIDSPRIKPWAVDQAIEDLQWLGLDWDEGPDKPLGDRKYIQSERLSLYSHALEELKSKTRIYPCICSRTDVLEAASAPHEMSDGPVYGGTCRSRPVEEASRLDSSFAWRFKSKNEVVSFEDGFRGQLSTNVGEALGDFVVYKNNDSPAYQLSVVVDDHEMNVTEVLRGDDLIQSTFRQNALYDFWGWASPRFVHVPLVVGTDGRRLAKRHGDTRLSYFRDRGVCPERIIGLLAHSLGWLEHPVECEPRELIEKFDLKRIPPEPFVVGPEEVKWLES